MDDQIGPPTKKPKLEECNLETDSLKDSILQADFTKDVDTVEDKFTVSEDKYNNFIHPDELEKLREFQVLDEVRSNDEDSNDEDSDSSDGKSVPEDEIEKMLEEDLPEDFKGAPKAKEKPYITRQKVVLEEKGVNHFEVLPLDWMMVRHYSGMPVYMHRASRVCTLSKPYFLGKGNTRRHDIPISAIPCLAYRKALEEEEKQKEIDKHIEEQIKRGTWQQSIDKNKSKSQTTHKKTDGNSSETNVANCPYLHGQRVQSDTQIPNNHDVLMCKKISNEKVVSEKAITKSNENKEKSSENITRNVETNDSENYDALIKSLSKSLDDEIKRINGINYCHDKIKGEEGELVSENVVENPISEENSEIKSTRIDDLDKLGNKMAPNNSEDTSTNKASAIKVNDKPINELNNSKIIQGNDTDKTNDIPNETSVTNDNQAKASHETSEDDSQDKPTIECIETDTEDESNKNQPIANKNIVDNQELLKNNNQAYDNENTSENEVLLSKQHLTIPETSNIQSFSNENAIDNEVLLSKQHLTIPDTSNIQSFSNENAIDNEVLLSREHLTIPETSNIQSFSNENAIDNEVLLSKQHLTIPETSNIQSFSNENAIDNEVLLSREHLTIPETSNIQSFSNENAIDNEVLLSREHLTIPETSNIQSFSNENAIDNEVLLSRQHLTIPETNSTQTFVNENTVDNEVPLNRQPVVLPGGMVMPPPRVETVSTSWKTQHLTHDQVNDYCKNLFRFKTVNIMHFKRWADRRKYTKARKTLQYPTLPEGTKLITIPAQPANGQDNGAGKASKRDWVMNMNGRSYLSVFHEYVRRALQKQPVYEFKQLENASTPYQATVYIGGMQYGVGHGSSKRSAKSAAARASIHILIPEMRAELDQQQPENNSPNEPDFSFFDYVGIEDPRITEFCAATCEPSPHAILRTCLLRNFGAGDKHIHTEMKKLEYQKIELTMKVGKHTATVVCKNKKTAKQRASQAILQALHPHVRSWGSLLRLYGSRSVKSCKEKKLEEQQITLLQDAARHNEPNYAVLEKLRHEMRKLRERDEAVVPIGTLLLKDDLPTHSGSNLNNVDL